MGGGEPWGVAADEDAGGDGGGELVARGVEGGEGEGGVEGDAGACAFDERGRREDEQGVAVVFDQAVKSVPVGVWDALQGSHRDVLKVEQDPGGGAVAKEKVG
jgi:hypothetical protein